MNESWYRHSIRNGYELDNVASLRLSIGIFFLTKPPTFHVSCVSKMNVLIYLLNLLCLFAEESQRSCHSVTAAAAAVAGASPHLTRIHGLPCHVHISAL